MPLFHEQSLKWSSLVYQIDYLIKAEHPSDAPSILLKSKQLDLDTEFDIFLSHSYSDAAVILGLKIEIEKMGYSVYVDWAEDSQLQRSDVTKGTADVLRIRMRHCQCLFFATSTQSSYSKWMPWECGYFDGINGKVAICPISKRADTDNYNGQEYLGLYPYVTKEQIQGKPEHALWINESPDTYISFNGWLKGKVPYKR